LSLTSNPTYISDKLNLNWATRSLWNSPSKPLDKFFVSVVHEKQMQSALCHKREMETDRQTDRQTDRHTDRDIQRETDRKTQTQTERDGHSY